MGSTDLLTFRSIDWLIDGSVDLSIDWLIDWLIFRYSYSAIPRRPVPWITSTAWPMWDRSAFSFRLIEEIRHPTEPPRPQRLKIFPWRIVYPSMCRKRAQKSAQKSSAINGRRWVRSWSATVVPWGRRYGAWCSPWMGIGWIRPRRRPSMIWRATRSLTPRISRIFPLPFFLRGGGGISVKKLAMIGLGLNRHKFCFFRKCFVAVVFSVSGDRPIMSNVPSDSPWKRPCFNSGGLMFFPNFFRFHVRV